MISISPKMRARGLLSRSSRRLKELDSLSSGLENELVQLIDRTLDGFDHICAQCGVRYLLSRCHCHGQRSSVLSLVDVQGAPPYGGRLHSDDNLARGLAQP